jgi:hypothetical protein
MTQPFNFEQALKDLQAGKSLIGKDSILGPRIKQLTEATLQAELEQHFNNEAFENFELKDRSWEPENVCDSRLLGKRYPVFSCHRPKTDN